MVPRGSLKNGANIRRNHWQVSFSEISLKLIYSLLYKMFSFLSKNYFILALEKKTFPVS